MPISISILEGYVSVLHPGSTDGHPTAGGEVAARWQVVLVLDAESEKDHAFAASIPPWIHVEYEALPALPRWPSVPHIAKGKANAAGCARESSVISVLELLYGV